MHLEHLDVITNLAVKTHCQYLDSYKKHPKHNKKSKAASEQKAIQTKDQQSKGATRHSQKSKKSACKS